MEPGKRLDSYEAIMHPFFDDIREPHIEQRGPFKHPAPPPPTQTGRSSKLGSAQERALNMHNKKVNNASFENQQFMAGNILPNMNFQHNYATNPGAGHGQMYNYNINLGSN